VSRWTSVPYVYVRGYLFKNCRLDTLTHIHTWPVALPGPVNLKWAVVIYFAGEILTKLSRCRFSSQWTVIPVDGAARGKELNTVASHVGWPQPLAGEWCGWSLQRLDRQRDAGTGSASAWDGRSRADEHTRASAEWRRKLDWRADEHLGSAGRPGPPPALAVCIEPSSVQPAELVTYWRPSAAMARRLTAPAAARLTDRRPRNVKHRSRCTGNELNWTWL